MTRNFKVFIPVLTAILWPAAGFSFDVVKTWTGGGNANFYNPPNWSGGTRPDYLPGGDNDALLFNGTGTGSTYNLNVNGTQTAYEVKSWLFTSGTYTFKDAQNLTLGDTSAKADNTGWLANSGTGTVTFNNTSVIGFRFGGIDASGGPITLGASPTLDVGFELNGAANNVTVKGSQPVTINGVITGTGTDTSAGGALIKDGSNTLILGGSSSSWAGRISILNGAVRVSKAGALGSDAGRTSIAGDAATGRLEVLGGIGLTEPLYLAGRAGTNVSDHLRNISGGNLLAGPVTLDAGGTDYTLQSDSGLLNISGSLNYGTQTGGSTLHLQGGGDGAISGVVGAAVSIDKEGSGTWTLSAANTYTGTTLVNAGRLNLTTAQTGTGAASVSDGATLGLTLTAGGQSFAPSDLTLGNATVALDLGSFGSNPTAPVISTGALTINGSSAINVKAGGLSVGQFPLIAYTSISGGGVAGLALGSLPARVSASLVDDSAHARINLSITGFDYPRWTGNIDGTWDTDDGTGTGTGNWREFNSGLLTRYLQGAGGTDGVLFDDTAAGPASVNLTTTLTPSFVKVNNDVAVYAFTGVGRLSGAATLNKDGPGRLIIANTGGNDYTGSTTVSGGSLEIGDGAQAGGGSLGTGAIVNNATLILNRPDNFTLVSAISGTGALRKKGPGIATLSGTSTFTGPASIEEGTLKLGSGNALGAGDGGTSVSAGAALDLNGQLLPASETVSIAGDGIGATGAILNTGTGSASVGLKNLVLTAPASIGGSTRWDVRDSPGGVRVNGFTLTKTGTNSVYFANVGETGIGDLVINGAASRLVFEGNSTLGGNPGTITVETGAQLGFENNTAVNTKPINVSTGTIRASAGTSNTLSSLITIDTAATFDTAANVEFVVDGRITGPGNVIKTTGGILKITGDNNDYVGVTQISTGALWLGNDNTHGVLPPGEVINNSQLVFRRTDSIVFPNVISGTGTLTFGNATLGDDAQTVTLSGASTFTGAVTVSRGFVRITSSSALGVGPKTIAVQSARKPSLVLNGSDGDLTLDSLLTFNTSSDGAAGAIVNEAGNNAINGVINLRNGGGGNTRINVLDGSLVLNGLVQAASDATSARTLFLDGIAPGVINGVISNATSGTTPQSLVLTKAGTGTWTLNAGNTYTGATAIQAGTLKLGPAGSIATSPSITLTAGAAFDVSAVTGFALASQSVIGTGTVVGAATVPPGSELNPGGTNAAGTISFNDGLTLAGGRLRTNVSIPSSSGPAADLIAVTGDLNITAPSTITIQPTGAVLAGTYHLIDYTGALNGDPNTVTISNTTRLTAVIDTTTPGQFNLVFGGSIGSLVWSGNGTTNTWDNSTTTTNFNAGTDRFYPVDAVTFNDSSANTTVTIGATVQPSSVTIDGTSNYTFNGTGGIGGVGSLTKTGTGVLTLNTANAYTGKTTLAGGSIVLGSAGRLSGTRWIDLGAGTLLDSSAITTGFTLGGVTDQRVLSGTGGIAGLFIVNSTGVIKPGATSNAADVNMAGDGIGALAFAADLTFAGGASPGAPRAVLQLAGVTGTVADPLDAAAVTAFGSMLPTQSDFIAVTGALNLDAGGTIRVELAAGYTPAYGDVFNLADWGSINLDADASGTGFDPTVDLDLPALPEGLGWVTRYFTTQGVLVVGVAKPVVDSLSVSPASTVNPGTQVTFSASVASPVSVTYQWRKNGAPIPGATDATLVLTAAEADEGSYSVTVTNITGSATSSAVSLAVNDPVSIITPPAGATRNPGQSVTFTVSAGGTPPLTYQWRKNGEAIDGETDDSLVVSSITEADQADYDVVVTNAAGGLASSKAALTVNDPVTIAADPQPRVVLAGSPVTFGVTASGTGPFIYQWRKDGSPIPNGNGSSYTLASSAFADAGAYDVVVTNSVNSRTSAAATLEVINGSIPRIVTPPQARLVATGSPLTLSVTAVVVAGGKYQWYKDGKAVAGATSATYSVAAAALTHAGSYTVKVTSTATTESSPALVGVVTVTDATYTLAKDGPATFTVATAGSGLQIQWNKSDEPVVTDAHLTVSADKKTLKVAKVAAADSGVYRATVTGPGGVLLAGRNALTVFTDAPQLILPISLPPAAVGADFSFQIPVNADTTRIPTAYAATPLAAGLKLDVKTGKITGKPTAATGVKPLKVTITASNAKGKSTTTADLTVAALPAGVAGSFVGPIRRDATLNAGLGGRLKLDVLSTAAFSGQVVLGSATYAFSGVLTNTVGGLTPAATISVARPGKPALALIFTIDPPNNRLSDATLSDGTVTLPLAGWRSTWAAKTHEPAFKGYYTLGLDIPENLENDLAIPQGNGYASFTVAPAGTLTLAGRLPDGEVITGSTFAGPGGEILVYQLLYASKGSLTGSFDIGADNPAAGTVSWFRPATATRLYTAGFGPLDLAAVGGRYVPPVAPSLVLGLQDGTNNASVTFSGARISATNTPPNLTASIHKGNKITVVANTARTTLVINATTGAFNGAFSLTDPVPSSALKYSRNAIPYQGLIVRTSSGLQGFGYYLLPQLPSQLPAQTPPLTLLTTPILSGQAVLQAASP